MERIAGRAAEWEGGMLGRKPDESLAHVTMATQNLFIFLSHMLRSFHSIVDSVNTVTSKSRLREELGYSLVIYSSFNASGAHRRLLLAVCVSRCVSVSW